MTSNSSNTVEQTLTNYIEKLESSKPVSARIKSFLDEFSQRLVSHPDGKSKLFSQVKPSDIDYFFESEIRKGLSKVSEQKLKEIRSFLRFSYQNGFISDNLALHIRIRRNSKNTSNSKSSSKMISSNRLELTAEGHQKLTEELAQLKSGRPERAEAIAHAASTGDVRENAPLEAAREAQGMAEQRISELEHHLSEATIIDESKSKSNVITIGAEVEVESDKKSAGRQKYTLVSQAEADPLKGRISIVSPIGKALLNKSKGDKISVQTPRVKSTYKILRISH